MKSNNNNSNKSNNYINKLNKVFKNNRKTITIVFCALVLVGIIFWGVNNKYNILTSINKKNEDSKTYTSDEVKYIKLQSDNYGSQGTWSISNTGDWKGISTVSTTLNIHSIPKIVSDKETDLILLVDTSSSVGIPSDIEKVAKLFVENSGNRVALISFNTKAKLETGFTNNTSTIENAFYNIQRGEMTNYYLAYQTLYNFLDSYEYDSNKNVIVVMYTDGKPTAGSPNEVSIYNAIKSEFPYVTIKAVQYNMGQTPKEEVVRVSDQQFTANSSSLRNVLNGVVALDSNYEKFIVTYDINDNEFNINSTKDISVTKGTVNIVKDGNDKKIVWTINNMSSVEDPQMTIKMYLKDEYIKQEGLYTLDNNIHVSAKFANEEAITKNTTDSIKLQKESHTVSYITNTPLGCLIGDENKEYFEYERVTLKSDDMKCSGYLFAGWKEITDTGINVSGTSFEMPSEDVVLKATWTKPDITKRMDGTINESSYPLYNAVRDAYTAGTAKKYTGAVQDTMDDAGNSDIYYYEKSANTDVNNKVAFAGYCWNIVRTTKTGGVKMQAMGKLTVNGSCRGFTSYDTIKYSNYFDEPMYPYLNSRQNEGDPYPLDSVALFGYMHNKIYGFYAQASEEAVLASEEVNYSNGTYTLVNPELTTSLRGKYTCFSSTETNCSKVRFYYLSRVENITLNFPPAYVLLENTPNIETAYDEMMYGDNLNTNDSSRKKLTDKWYEENLSSYSDYLEDVIHCIDRYPLEVEQEQELKKFVMGTSSQDDIWFNDSSNPYGSNKFGNKEAELVCTNILSSYSVSNPKAKLKYPISASISIDEYLLTGGYLYRPGSFSDYGSYMDYRLSGIGFSTPTITPTISFKSGIEFTHGNGSMDDPYVIK